MSNSDSISLKDKERHDIMDHILEAAFELIRELGYSGMSMRSLAKKVGMQPGSLYYHFPSKVEVLEEVIENLQARRLAAWRTQKPKNVSPSLQLKAFVRFNIRRQLSEPYEEKLIKLESLHLAPEQQERVADQEALYARELSSIIQRGVSDRIYAAREVEVVTLGVMGLFSSVPTLRRATGSSEDSLLDLVGMMTNCLLTA